MALADNYANFEARTERGWSEEYAAARNYLESALREFQRQEFNRGVEAAANALRPKPCLPVPLDQSYSGSVASCGCSTYTDSAGNKHAMQCALHAILALKEKGE
jgi:hypothetical protein